MSRNSCPEGSAEAVRGSGWRTGFKNVSQNSCPEGSAEAVRGDGWRAGVKNVSQNSVCVCVKKNNIP